MERAAQQRAVLSAAEKGQVEGAAVLIRPLHIAFSRGLTFLTAAALIWSIGSSLWYYPHSLSYFNELVGGPENGHEHLLDSSIAWGQDLLYLKDWYDAHPEARPLYLAAFGFPDPRVAGITFAAPRGRLAEIVVQQNASMSTWRWPPGWYAIDVNYLHNCTRPAANGNGGLVPSTDASLPLAHFRWMRTVATAGHSFHIYHVAKGDTEGAED